MECRGLSCGYPDRGVLGNVDLGFKKGEAVALLGINGSGKSTLLRTLCGLLKPLDGEVWLAGRPLSELSFAETARLVSSVPQEEPAVFPFTVREMVTMGRIAYGSGIFDTREDREAASQAMEVAECKDLADRPFTKLSGGERQRVLIARAIAQDTPVLLLDEPTSHLDASHQVSTAALVRRLAAEGKTILSAVHDLNLAAAMADRAVLLDSGGISADGPVEGVLTDPRLDAAYGVAFERVRTETGRLLVVARSLSC